VLFFAHRPAHAQGMVRPDTDGELHFTTNIGSFKLLGTDDKDVTGHFEMTAKGTVLVSGVKNKPTTTGSLKLEYSYEPLKKYAYHGQGTLTLDGTWRSVQWFGTGLSGTFKGRGKFRLVGEFDKDLNTGLYWTTAGSKKEYWPANSVMEVLVPGFTSDVVKPEAVPVPSSSGGK